MNHPGCTHSLCGVSGISGRIISWHLQKEKPCNFKCYRAIWFYSADRTGLEPVPSTRDRDRAASLLCLDQGFIKLAVALGF